jgi:hypothetical protein
VIQRPFLHLAFAALLLGATAAVAHTGHENPAAPAPVASGEAPADVSPAGQPIQYGGVSAPCNGGGGAACCCGGQALAPSSSLDAAPPAADQLAVSHFKASLFRPAPVRALPSRLEASRPRAPPSHS